jgi:hypothetical protein
MTTRTKQPHGLIAAVPQTRTVPQTASGYPAIQVIASRVADPKRPADSFEAAFQGLVLDQHRPLALELSGEGSTGAKGFLVRGTKEEAIYHAQTHLRAFFPQIQIRAVPDAQDPLRVHLGETVSCCELRPGAAAYLPLRQMEEADPLRGLLGALSVPRGLRAVIQIALVPASATWSAGLRRKAVEHPLESERRSQARAQALARNPTPNTAALIWMAAILAGLLLSQQWHWQLPAWVMDAFVDLFHGQLPPLLWSQAFLLYGGLLLVLLGPLLLGLLVHFAKPLFSPDIYNQLEVARKTSQMAYRSRIRLYVFSAGPVLSYRKVFQLGMRLVSGSLFPEVFSRRKKRTHGRIGRTWRLLRLCRVLVRRERTHRQFHARRRRIALESMTAAFRQFDTASANYFQPVFQPDARAHRLVQGHWPRWLAHSRHLVTSDFLSRAWYLPQESMFELPGLEQKAARTRLVPTCLIAPSNQPALGVSTHAGYELPFALPDGFLRQHTLVGGKTGEGKSVLLAAIARVAMQQGDGLFLLDPHGDLAYDVLSRVPASRRSDVVFIDLADRAWCIGMNPLDVTMKQGRDLVVASLVTTFSTLWESGWGPRMEAPFRAAVASLFEANEARIKEGKPQYTLLDVLPLLLNPAIQTEVVKRLADPFLRRFWYDYVSKLDRRQWRDRIDPILTKTLHFEAKIARSILGQPTSTFDLKTLISQRKIVVIRLAAGETGLVAPIFGATILGFLLTALREQSRLPLTSRIPVNVMVDEFQSIPGADYNLLLSELRKFGASATLATQSLDYLSRHHPHLLATTLSNVKQYFIFRMSAADAHLIARELSVEEGDIVHQDTYSCYVRLVYGHEIQPTFSLRLLPPPPIEASMIEAFRLHSRRYMREKPEVEEEVTKTASDALGTFNPYAD